MKTVKNNIRDYLHLYLGCKFILKITNPKSFDKFTTPMHFSVDALRASYATNEDHIDPILLLRPLSSMTEEEAKELFKM